MLFTNLKLALRQLRKQKFYTAINVTGLALGIACCLMIAIFIRHELSYDRHHSKADRIHRVLWEGSNTSGQRVGVVSAPMAKALQEDFPEVLKAGKMFYPRGDNRNTLVRRGDGKHNFFETNLIFGDREVFDIFDFPVVSGDGIGNFGEPQTVVITQAMADKYFPDENAVGKSVIFDDETEFPFQISAVIENLPATSHIQFGFLLCSETLRMSRDESWLNTNFYTYALLKQGTDPDALEAKLPQLIERYIPQYDLTAFFNNLAPDGDSPNRYYKFSLQPLTDMHLHSAPVNEPLVHGNIQYVWLYGGVALLVLLIAVINFMNLSTARSANRAKEVGVRKVLGSFRKDLVMQFLSESILLSVIAFLGAIALVAHLLPYFYDLVGKNLEMPIGELWFLPAIFGASLIVGLLAGLYPSFYLSRFAPVKVLSGKVSKGVKSSRLRSGLVVFQFASSVLLIIGTAVIYKQLDYMLNKKLGFDKDQVLLIHDCYTLDDNMTTFKEELQRLPEVKSVTVSGYLPVSGTFRNDTRYWPEGKTMDDFSSVQRWVVDADYLETFGLELVKGQNFTGDRQQDSLSIIISETAARHYGLTEPVGSQLITNVDYDPTTQTSITGKKNIIGVVRDFHFEPLHKNIKGVILVPGTPPFTTCVKANVASMDALLAKAENTWSQLAPNQEFRYTFLDDSLAKMYESEQQTGKALGAFAVLAIIVACLGLFALATFLAEQRTKEIGIRKVLGATTIGLVSLLSKDFLKLVIIALLIASPIAYYFMDKWLQEFAYRIDISWWVFAATSLVAVGIAFLTVSFQSVRAALANPVDSLRSE